MIDFYEELATKLSQAPDLGRVTRALARETVLRQVMTETGESREIVADMIDAMDSMSEEAVLDLTDGEPTTLRDALSRYVERLNNLGNQKREEIYANIADELDTLLTYPWPVQQPGVHVDLEDNLERREGEPHGYHRRRTTETGYPLMGSSDAEREESHQRAIRIQRQAMRDHVFVGDGQYCEAMLPTGVSGSPETGIIAMTAGCGYGRDTHPDVS